MTIQIAENTSKRRDKLIIMAEIINIAKKGSSKTHIMFKANLSFSQLNLYISILANAGLLEKFSNNGKIVFQSTPKGMEFMKRQQQVIELLNVESDIFQSCVKTSQLGFKTFRVLKTSWNPIRKGTEF